MKFTTIAKAKKLTGLSYLGNVNSSSKIEKGAKYNYMTYILYLAPANMSGYEVCAGRTAECTKACLNESGHNKIDTKEVINGARIKKTKLFFEEREFFCAWLFAEIESAKAKAEKTGANFAVRLNGTSDILPTLFVHNGKNVFQHFADVQFYDYTKILKRFDQLAKYTNYDLTFSFNGYNLADCISLLNAGKGRVAIVFEGKKLPIKFAGFDVIDADLYDMRFIDQKNVFCGLKFKKVRNKIDTSKNRFIIPQNSSFSIYA